MSNSTKTQAPIFPVLILIGRPASGKSEIIDYLRRLDPAERIRRFHIGALDMLDDFPMLWTWFEEDQILSHELGKPRLHTDEEGYFLQPYLWNLLIRRLGLEYEKLLRDNPNYHLTHTALVEFSRGSEHGGYREAFAHLSEKLLIRAAVVYVDVSFEESLRKNRKRFNPDRPDSILEHGLPDAKLERLYGEVDWEAFSQPDPHVLQIGRLAVPYAVFENQDDVTSGNTAALGERLEQVLEGLWQRFKAG